MLHVTYGPAYVTEAGTLQMGTVRMTPGPDITHTTKESTMRASFDNQGNLVLHPESTLERMAAKAFVLQMKTRAKPQILIDAGDGSAVPQSKASVSLIAQEDEVPGQQKLDEVARSVGGI